MSSRILDDSKTCFLIFLKQKQKQVARIFRGIQRWGQVLEFAAKIIGLILKEFKKVIKFL